MAASKSSNNILEAKIHICINIYMNKKKKKSYFKNAFFSGKITDFSMIHFKNVSTAQFKIMFY